MENPNQQQVRIPMKDTTPIKCGTCGHEVFESAFLLRTVSALRSPTGREEIMPVQTFYCIKCQNKYEPPMITA